MKKPKISEASVKKRIVEGLRGLGIPCRRFGGGPYTATGWPDIVGCLPGGRMLMLEVKAPDAKPRKDESAQRKTLNVFAASGAMCATVASWDDVFALLKGLWQAEEAAHL